MLDTETTGLKEDDEIIQLGIVGLDGSVLFWSNIRPTAKKRVAPKAKAIHGLGIPDLMGFPTYAEFASDIGAAIRDRTIIAYNAEFDRRMFIQTHVVAGGYVPSP